MLASIVILLTAAAPPAAAPVAAKPLPQPLVQCEAFGPKRPGCVEPPLIDSISIWGVWEPAGANGPEIVRAPSMIQSGTETLPLGGFPKALRAGDSGGTAAVTLRLRIGADGAIEDCRSTKIEMWLINPGAKRIDLAPDAALGAVACELTRTQRKFRPALDTQGGRVPAEAETMVRFMRQRGGELIAPAPPPPSRWLGRAPYDRSSVWPPRSSLMEPVRFTLPKFKDFLPDRKRLPQLAIVGVLLDFAADGRALNCEVKYQSGDNRLDRATCAALLSVRNTPTRWQVRELPVEVTWSGDKAKLKLPVAAAAPGLTGPITIPPAQIPAGELPKRPVVVRVQVDAYGKPASCMVVGPSYIDAVDAASCRIAVARGAYSFGTDAFGRPAAGGMDLRADWIKGVITGSGGPSGY